MSALPVPRLGCREFVELVSDYLEGVLSQGVRERVEAHVQACSDCRVYVVQVRRTVGALADVGERDVPGPMLEELVVAFRGWTSR